MSVWDYLDRHEIIGSFVVLCLAFFAMLICSDLVVNFARALQTKWTQQLPCPPCNCHGAAEEEETSELPTEESR